MNLEEKAMQKRLFKFWGSHYCFAVLSIEYSTVAAYCKSLYQKGHKVSIFNGYRLLWCMNSLKRSAKYSKVQANPAINVRHHLGNMP